MRIWGVFFALVFLGFAFWIHRSNNESRVSQQVFTSEAPEGERPVENKKVMPKREQDQGIASTKNSQPAQRQQAAVSGGPMKRPSFEEYFFNNPLRQLKLIKQKKYPQKNGSTFTVSIYKDRTMPHPVRVEETQEGSTRTFKRMVADHVMVVLKDGKTTTDLNRVLDKYGAAIREPMVNPRNFIVAISDVSVEGLDYLKKSLAEEKDVIEMVEMDYIYFRR